MCLVVFQKIFWKIFSGVWKRRRKTQTQKNKPQPRKIAISPSQRRNLAVARSRSTSRSRDGAISWSTLREIAPSIAISPSRDRAGEIAIRRRNRDRAIWVVGFSGLLGLCFPPSFPNTRKYFPENFLKYNQTHKNIFLFRKLAFPENMYFSENVLRQPNTASISFVHL